MLRLPSQLRLPAGNRHYQNPEPLLSFGLLGLPPEQEPNVGSIQGDQSRVVMLVLPSLHSSPLLHQGEEPKASNSHPGYAARTRPACPMRKPNLVAVKAPKCYQLSREDFDDIWTGWCRTSPCLTDKSASPICPPRHGPEGPEGSELTQGGQTCIAAHKSPGGSIRMSSHCSSEQSCQAPVESSPSPRVCSEQEMLNSGFGSVFRGLWATGGSQLTPPDNQTVPLQCPPGPQAGDALSPGSASQLLVHRFSFEVAQKMDLGSPTLKSTSTLFLLFMFFDSNKTNTIHYGSDMLSVVPA